jgi:hypothetical protein
LFEEDRRYFAAADLNGDQILTLAEFGAFQNPEHAKHMHNTLIEVDEWENKMLLNNHIPSHYQNTLSEKDANKDGKIDLKEFMGDLAQEQPQSEW